MPSRLVRSRAAAYTRQSGRCYYCDLPLWLDDPAAFRVRHNLTPKVARSLRCTAEHLKARQDGGTDAACNIARRVPDIAISGAIGVSGRPVPNCT